MQVGVVKPGPVFMVSMLATKSGRGPTAWFTIRPASRFLSAIASDDQSAQFSIADISVYPRVAMYPMVGLPSDRKLKPLPLQPFCGKNRLLIELWTLMTTLIWSRGFWTATNLLSEI